MSDVTARLDAVEKLVEAVEPLLCGQPPEIVGGALAYLVATLIAGHVVLDDDDEIVPEKTQHLRDDLLDQLIETTRQLIPVNEAAILEKRGLQ